MYKISMYMFQIKNKIYLYTEVMVWKQNGHSVKKKPAVQLCHKYNNIYPKHVLATFKI